MMLDLYFLAPPFLSFACFHFHLLFSSLECHGNGVSGFDLGKINFAGSQRLNCQVNELGRIVSHTLREEGKGLRAMILRLIAWKYLYAFVFFLSESISHYCWIEVQTWTNLGSQREST